MTEKRARVVIADLSSADEASCTNIYQALQFFFSLHNSLPGTPKIQLFALFVVGKCVQCLVPLQNVKLNWLAVSKCISTLQSTGDAHFGPTTFEGFILKCDLQDALVNPINIPKGKALTMETTLNPTIPVHAVSHNKPVKPETYTLRPVKFLRICNLCESVVYGVPVVVQATVCWKLPWDELERNQTQFMGVKTHLQKQDLCLLLNETRDGLTSYFVLLPSPGPTMLIKSIATREIIMPHDTPVTSTDWVVPGDVLVQLDKIEIATSFNPFDFTSGLFSHNNNQTQQQANFIKPLGYKTSKSTSLFANSNRHDVSTATNSSAVKPAFRYNSGSDFQRKTGGNNTHRKADNLPAKQDIYFSDKYVPKFGNSAATNQWLVNNKQSESSQGVVEPPAKKKPVFSKFPNKL